jgi:UV DNA damage endonuclease
MIVNIQKNREKMNLGYACINMELAEKGITTSRGMILRTFKEKGISYASELALQNVTDLLKVLEWNTAHGVQVFRVTSDLFPWATAYRLKDLPDYKKIRKLLEQAGRLPVRISAHPGPFNKMAGTGIVLENTIRELETHAEVFDLMNLSQSHWNKINIHVGGAYGNKLETLKKFATNFKKLSKGLRSRLTIENDDKPGLFSVEELIPLHEMTGIPIVFDYFHHKLHPGTFTEEDAYHAAFATWPTKPVFHFSSSRKQNEDLSSKKEAHSDWAHERINAYGKDVDIILETKMKEKALLRYWKEFGK